MSKKNKTVSKDKSAPKPASRPDKKGERQLRVEFTPEELLAIAKKLAEANADFTRAEEDKKAVTSQLKAKCDSIAARVSELSGKINSGFEYRQVNVVTKYDDPKTGTKTTYRLDKNEVVEVEAMTLAELQGELPLTTSGTSGNSGAGNVVTFSAKPAERPPLRTVTGSGVVATEEDGKGADLQNDDDEKV